MDVRAPLDPSTIAVTRWALACELLDARLARGWTPTPTGMQGGARVLGYAACAVPRVP